MGKASCSSVQSLFTGTTPACPAPCGEYDVGGKCEIRPARADADPEAVAMGTQGMIEDSGHSASPTDQQRSSRC